MISRSYIDRYTPAFISGAFSIMIFLLAGMTACAQEAGISVKNDKRLAKIHRDIVADYPDLTHLSRAQLLALAGDEDQPDPLIFDVREKEEYAVSHLEGAIQIDPDTDPKDFLATYQSLLAQGRPAIFYCSVGRRSSRLADQVQSHLKEGATDQKLAPVYNLEGGIFRWRNDNQPLTRSGKTTDEIHSYNWFWGRYVDDKSSIRLKAPISEARP